MLRLVINLDSSKQRWNDIQKRLNDLHIEVERVSAVDGRKLSEDALSKITYPLSDKKRVLFTRQLSKGEIGCFLSHRKCWQKLVDSGEDWAVIMEDDLIISDRAKIYMQELTWLPDNIRICQLSTSDPTRKLWVKNSIIQLKNGDKIIEPLDKAHGTLCYVISKEAAKDAIKYSEKLLSPVDDYLFSPYFEINKIYGTHRLNPAVVTTDLEDDSDIGDRRAETKKAPFWIRHGIRRFIIRHRIKRNCRSGIRVISGYL